MDPMHTPAAAPDATAPTNAAAQHDDAPTTTAMVTAAPSAAWTAASAALRGKRMLAPMVRIGTLPLRMLAHDYGADYVYSPEIIDKRIIGSDRVVNELLGTIDYVKKGTLNFRCLPAEKPRLIFQMGTADPDLAVQAAQTVAQDVAYVDVNCGCPKWFSIQGGMGAALLYEPDRLCAILEALVARAGVPVTCKIRMLEDVDKTLALVDRIVNTGIVALAVHCRTRHMRPTDPGDWAIWSAITERYAHRLPIIANGDIFEGEDMDRAIAQAGVSSVMLARAAQANPSVFAHPAPLADIHDVIRQYIRYAIKYDSIFQNAKYVLLQMIPEPKSPIGQRLIKSKSLRTLAEIWDMEDEHDQLVAEREARRAELLASVAAAPAAAVTAPVSVPAEEEITSPSKKRVERDEEVAAPAPPAPEMDADKLLGHVDFNKQGGDESECPYIPHPIYIPTKKRKVESDAAEPEAAAAAAAPAPDAAA
ncbi:tRNA-dihydrouridine synthase 2 [Blastocladiella emersonii ATCC 22665]|nr:tRNA-dihydrouridine synthase 2 [Blastocladiella emersonii ATCC 22665]